MLVGERRREERPSLTLAGSQASESSGAPSWSTLRMIDHWALIFNLRSGWSAEEEPNAKFKSCSGEESREEAAFRARFGNPKLQT